MSNLSKTAMRILIALPEIMIGLYLVWFFIRERRYFRKLRESRLGALHPDMRAIMERGYIVRSDGTAITCITCGRTSYNTNDVTSKYCGYCKKFHEG